MDMTRDEKISKLITDLSADIAKNRSEPRVMALVIDHGDSECKQVGTLAWAPEGVNLYGFMTEKRDESDRRRAEWKAKHPDRVAPVA